MERSRNPTQSARAGDRFTQQTRTLVGWVERSRNPTQSARLGARSLYTTDSDSSRLGGAIAKPNTVG
ncbi:hypothetical protein [Limnospira fusiformis]|uniref:hypothetical protein n=1 Tax=Limnospira fusiformis TaxID=54297 RepID=UPI001448FCD1|nr:hypothetical protein HFV01_28690 [Limnospira fusiformis SAG 85.79]